jgi:signal transduction histidine kinase
MKAAEVLSRPRVPAREFFAENHQSEAAIEQAVAENRRLRLSTIRTTLGAFRREAGADNVTVFRMHKISRIVSILEQVGQPFPRYESHGKGLRYSPIRDVCEDGEEWCHDSVPMRWADRHRNLLNICDPSRQYLSCAASFVPEPPGDEFSYGLFAFLFPPESESPGHRAFRVAHHVLQHLPETQAAQVRNALMLQMTREYASQVSRQLLARQHKETQIRQAPSLMAGMTLAMMSHDLANCLMGADHALARLEQVLRKGYPVSSEHLSELGSLGNLTGRAIGITESAKRRAQSQQKAPTKIHLVELIRSTCQAVMFEAERTRVEIFYTHTPPIAIYCREGLLERVLFNLLLNGVQQIGLSLRGAAGGHLQVSHFLREAKQGTEIVIQVYDNGPGIQGYRQASIFHPGETTRPDGSGMGLAIAKEEAAKLGGTVRVARSILFCGSCFEVVLPGKIYVGTSVEGDLRE